jgi:acetyltransferase-like isoleucine patch superfamily enzyme
MANGVKSAFFRTFVGKILKRQAFVPFGGHREPRRGISGQAQLIGRSSIDLAKGVSIHPFASLNTREFGKGRIRIGENSEIHSYAFLHTFGGWIEIGSNCSVNPFCVLYGHGGLKIGNMVRIATHTVIIPANHGFTDSEVPIMLQEESREGIVINDNVWIGASALLLDGIVVGQGAVIGAGAVVTADVPSNSIVGGSPARVIGWRPKASSEPAE